LISGNKPFKLTGYLEMARNMGRSGLLTFGGAWSNHIHATAFAARKAGLACTGIIRGERPMVLSAMLQDAEQAGMVLRFVSRTEYKRLTNATPEDLQNMYPDMLIIPEGGAGITGVTGAANIMNLIPEGCADWIVCACGTGTTLAGLLSSAPSRTNFLGVSILKGHSGMYHDIRKLAPFAEQIHLEITDRFHLGGYARFDDGLIRFMNGFHEQNGIPTDIVYTAKLMIAIDTLGSEGFFPSNSRVIAIHSGGLQGNRSLQPGSLRF
jgi:1-aminocyclopropane-1-carboxylate deaminase/D-cysteine desulfhydrase-like pyridoxal-dependent ACC family enzyme